MEWVADRIPRASRLGRIAESVSLGFSCFNKVKRASKLDQWIKVTAAKPDSRNLTSGSQKGRTNS